MQGNTRSVTSLWLRLDPDERYRAEDSQGRPFNVWHINAQADNSSPLTSVGLSGFLIKKGGTEGFLKRHNYVQIDEVPEPFRSHIIKEIDDSRRAHGEVKP